MNSEEIRRIYKLRRDRKDLLRRYLKRLGLLLQAVFLLSYGWLGADYFLHKNRDIAYKQSLARCHSTLLTEREKKAFVTEDEKRKIEAKYIKGRIQDTRQTLACMKKLTQCKGVKKKGKSRAKKKKHSNIKRKKRNTKKTRDRKK